MNQELCQLICILPEYVHDQVCRILSLIFVQERGLPQAISNLFVAVSIPFTMRAMHVIDSCARLDQASAGSLAVFYMICTLFLASVHRFVGSGRIMVLKIWMAHGIPMSVAAFCAGDDRCHEYTALCDASEHFTFVVSVRASDKCVPCRAKARVRGSLYPELTLEACLPSFCW